MTEKDFEKDTPAAVEPTEEYIPAPVFDQVVTEDVAARTNVFGQSAVQEQPQNSIDPIPVAAPASEPVVAPPPPAPKKKKKKVGCIIAILVLLLVVLLTGGVILGLLFGIPYLKYQQALDALNSGAYLDAYTQFQELGNYEDSIMKAQEARYRYAKSLLDNGDFENSKTIFEELGGYMDSTTMILECRYQQAQSYLKNKEYTKAKNAFTALNDYRDSATLRQEAVYQLAMEYFADGDHDNALEQFATISGYSDSADQILAVKYDYVINNKHSGDYTTYAYLQDLKRADYKDAATIYSSLYAWKVTITAVNTSKDDYTTDYTSISKYDPVIFHFTVSGGTPDGTLDLKISGYNISGQAISYSFNDVYDGFNGWYGWTDGVWLQPQYGTGGTITLSIYDSAGNFMASRSITINNY